MISIPEADVPAAPASLGAALARGIPRAYAVLFFSADTRLGWCLLAVSMFAPDLGLVGLAGTCAAGILAWVLGFDRANIRNGYLLFNTLLVCLTLAWLNRCYHFPPVIYAVLFLASVVGGFFLSTAMQSWVGIHFNLSTHSMPAVAVGYVLYFLGFHLYGPPVMAAAETNAWLDLNFLPPALQTLFQAFGAMLFQPHALPGLLVFVALTVVSPLTSLSAALAVFTGAYTLTLLGYPLGPEGVTWCGFNFLLCGIALGSGYFVVSLTSLSLALAGSFLCALLSISIAVALRYFGLLPSALPYNLVVLVLVYALKQRRAPGRLTPSPAPGSLPESAARLLLLNVRRFPDMATPALFPPFEGGRTVTQGFNGKLTHRGEWGDALDFELVKEGAKYAGDGGKLEEFHTFDTTVLSPCAGVVASAATHVRDNAPGSNNADENWGNHVMIYSDAGYYVLLAHLKQGSVTVYTGQRVVRGTVLGMCGNSGRSPVPHLHLHVQNTIHLGAPTRPFCLKHYIEAVAGDGNRDGGRVYKTSGVPATDARIETPVPDPVIGEMFAAWLPGEYRYRVTGDNGASWEETIRVDFDELGSFRMRSHRCEARLTAFLSENVFYTTNYQGSDQSLLAFIAAGLGRVPCVEADGLSWRDQASAVPFFPAPFRWLQGLLDPFLGPSILAFVYSMRRDGDGYAVRCAQNGTAKALANSPREITTRIAPRRGVVSLEARLGNDRVLRAEQVHYEPLA
ncbi:MAG TPA: urea transporter [Chthoniobacteraceae bacterium]|nr:urea transporter [Chthoniobacteraceae bacterium]